MPLPLITEVVERDTMATEDTTMQTSLQMPAITTTEIVVAGTYIHRVKDIVQSVQKSHNVSYVANLGIQYTSVINI